MSSLEDEVDSSIPPAVKLYFFWKNVHSWVCYLLHVSRASQWICRSILVFYSSLCDVC